MNPDKFTYKTNEAFGSAYVLAMSVGHAQFTLLHLASALGIFFQAICSEGGEESARATERVLKQALKKLPCQSPPPDEILARTTLIMVIRRAQAVQKSHGDTHLAINQLILGILKDSQIGDLLKEAGMASAKSKFEVEKLHGKKGKKNHDWV